MKYHSIFRKSLLACLGILLWSCSSSDYDEIPQTPVVMDLTLVPYQTLSEYKFFDGAMKDLVPAYGVIPYEPASALFSDYAKKKRFIWMPAGLKATYDGDGKVLQMPTGAALVKNFYYDHVQPSNTTRIIETRIMIKKDTGWIFANYIWNDAQTEATLSASGNTTDISWTDDMGNVKTVAYSIPTAYQCTICHNTGAVPLPIGIKPQNLNTNYNYPEGTKNQLDKLVSFGYLEDNLPQNIESTVNFNDTSKPLALRVRSYFDSNCAHCHQDGGYAEFYALRFQFSETALLANMGVCVEPNHQIPGFVGRLVKPGDAENSMVHYRMATNDESYRMPFIGRSIIHEEGVALVAEWINSLSECE